MEKKKILVFLRTSTDGQDLQDQKNEILLPPRPSSSSGLCPCGSQVPQTLWSVSLWVSGPLTPSGLCPQPPLVCVPEGLRSPDPL